MATEPRADDVIEVPFVIRGEVISDFAVEHRSGDLPFRTPDPHAVLAEDPIALAHRHGRSPPHHARRDHRLSRPARATAAALRERAPRAGIRAHRERVEPVRARPAHRVRGAARAVLPACRDPGCRGAASRALRTSKAGCRKPTIDGRDVRIRVFGARTTHVVAGNSPGVSAQTIVRNAITRSDAIIKTPANDPVTAVAILRTMVDLDPDHPLTKHVSAVHWRGGDEVMERVAFTSPNIDKIVAWGGAAGIKHVAQYVGPGVELIALDPKLSVSMLGSDVLTDPELGAEAARRLAMDVGLMNQEGCVNSRVAYLDVERCRRCRRRSARVSQPRCSPRFRSCPSNTAVRLIEFPPRCATRWRIALLTGEPEVVGGGTRDGGVLISWDGRHVDYLASLAARYVNLVPVRDLASVLEGISSITQTCGVYPPELRESLRDALALAGVQRVVTLGGAAANGDNQTIPQDAIEVLRRMCRWIIDEGDPAQRCDRDGLNERRSRTMNVEDLILVSVDDHVVEPPTVFDNQLPRDCARPGAQSRQARRRVRRLGVRGRGDPEHRAQRGGGRLPEEYGLDPTAYDEMRPGCYDVHARIDDMNANGVLGSMCFPSFPQFCGQLFARTAGQGLRPARCCTRTTTGTSRSGAGRPGSVHPAGAPGALGRRPARRRGPPGRRARLPRHVVLGEPGEAGLSELALPALGPVLAGVPGPGHRRVPAHRLVVAARRHGRRRAVRRHGDSAAAEHRAGRRRSRLVAGAAELPATSGSRSRRAASAGSRTSSTRSTTCTASSGLDPPGLRRPAAERGVPRADDHLLHRRPGRHRAPPTSRESTTITWECDYPHSDSEWPRSPEGRGSVT